MRVPPVAALLLVTLASCQRVAPAPEKGPSDLTIDIVLALDQNKCVVSFVDKTYKSETKAVAYTRHAVVWQVTRNDCGDKKKLKVKALGLKNLRLRKDGSKPAWACSTLDFVSGSIGVPPQFRCDIPSAYDPNTPPVVGIYDYEIDGDEVDPADPGLDMRRNG